MDQSIIFINNIFLSFASPLSLSHPTTVSQLDDDDDAFDVNDYRDVISSTASSHQLPSVLLHQQQQSPLLLTSTGSLDYDFYEDMDERDSIYLDAVSLNSDGPSARKSLYLSRQTVYHSAEELPLDGANASIPPDGTLRSIKTTTESLLNDSRANGGLPNLPYEPRPGGGSSSTFGGGILKRPGLTTKYNEEVPSTSPLLEKALDSSHPDQTTTTTTTTNTNNYNNQTSNASTNNNRRGQPELHPTTSDRGSKHEPRQIVTYSLWKARVKASFFIILPTTFGLCLDPVLVLTCPHSSCFFFLPH